MKFTLTIDCDNAAFDDDRNAEVARILSDLSMRVRLGNLDIGPPLVSRYRTLFDINGNDCGRASYVR